MTNAMKSGRWSHVCAVLVAAAVMGCDDGAGGAGADAEPADGAYLDSAGDDAGPTGDAGADTGSPLPAGNVLVGCPDGDHAEPLPTIDGDLAPAEALFGQGSHAAFILAALEARYPMGQLILQGGLDTNHAALGIPQDCVTAFLADTSSADAIYRRMSTLVHECGHYFDIGLGDFSQAAYWITDTVQFTCSQGGLVGSGGKTFARSLLNEDEFADLHAPCESFSSGGDCDPYAALYLAGGSGNQGFDTVLEETVQYVNSLATGYAFADRYVNSVSERDGILTFLWYTMRYLRLARLEHPDAYALLRDDDCWRRAILTVWGRAWLYLDLTEGHPRLGINDAFLGELVADEDLLGEIQRLREAEGCVP